jgi:predicted amidohydrolase YtcJ
MRDTCNLKADLALINGFIYTEDPARRFADALVVHGNRIRYIGNAAGAKGWIGPKTRVIDLKGKMVLPGFVDSHCHLTSGVCEIYEPVLHGINTVEGYQQAVRNFAHARPGLPSIQAGGWINAVFDPHGPSKESLDAVVPAIPVVLFSEDYHNAWVNSKALQMAGITASTPDPARGVIERTADGSPSGTLREAAVDLVKKAIPPYTAAQVQEGLAFFQKKAHALGITTVYNPGASMKDRTDMNALHNWERSGTMKLRVPTALEVEPDDPLSVVEELVELRAREQGGYFKVIAAKIFMDGVLEGGTAYLEEPYLHKPGSRGMLNWEPRKFNRMCVALDKARIQIHVHSIGDGATRVTLDGFAEARRKNGSRDSRHSITHLQFVRKVDIDRFAELGVVAVPQPYWFVMDANYNQALTYVGQERAERQYPMRSFFEKGVIVASASDYNVTLLPNPLLAIELGVTRTVPGDDCMLASPDFTGILDSMERVPVEEMINSFTIHGAFAAFLEKQIGSLEIGKKADFIILDQNLLALEPTKIHHTCVLLTVFNGEQVYCHNSFNE